MLTNIMLVVAALLSGGVNKSPDPAPARQATESVAPAQAVADRVIARVQAFYDDTAHLTAKFRQTYTNATFGRNSVSSGRVWLKKPGKMRWDYINTHGKVDKSFISDGKTLWAVEHDNKQAYIKNLNDEALPVAVTFLTGTGQLGREFKVALDKSKTYGAAGDYVLELTPKKRTAQYKTLWLVVDPKSYRVKQSIILEPSGNTNHFRFYEPNTRAPVKESYFHVSQEALRRLHYRIIDGDK
ncbi:MAG TPA: outer membrane lipoprotein carrier protein LolA [Kofleriaceae bacterium]|nr:outer membrane lipoprotein carrier protein LolA [Kofleriaceae bacterium]